MKPPADGAPRLRFLQRWMASLILDASARNDEPAAVQKLVLAPLRGTRAERLSVYRDGYPARLREALEETYPAVSHVVGHASFADLTDRYVGATGPTSYDLCATGAGLPEFLRGDALAESLPFLPDLAALEWRIARAFHATEEPPFDSRSLAGWPLDRWEHTVVRFQPSVSLVSSPWPILDVWAARARPREDVSIDLRDRAERVLVRRAGLDVRCERLGEDDARVLRALLDARPLGEVAEGLAAEGVDPSSVAACFARLARLGLVAGTSPGESTSHGRPASPPRPACGLLRRRGNR